MWELLFLLFTLPNDCSSKIQRVSPQSPFFFPLSFYYQFVYFSEVTSLSSQQATAYTANTPYGQINWSAKVWQWLCHRTTPRYKNISVNPDLWFGLLYFLSLFFWINNGAILSMKEIPKLSRESQLREEFITRITCLPRSMFTGEMIRCPIISH